MWGVGEGVSRRVTYTAALKVERQLAFKYFNLTRRERLNMSSQQLLSIQNRLLPIAAKLEQPVEFLETTVAPVNLRQNAVAVCGILRCGKSSLINAVLTRNLLPVDIPTNLALLNSYHISVTNGRPLFIKVHFSGGVTEDVEETTAIDKAQLETWGSELDFLEIQAPFPNFPEGLQLIETPSIGMVDFGVRTQSILDRVSSVILVVDANLDLSPQEIEFLKSLPINIQHLIVVANKIDLVDPEMRPALVNRIFEQIDALALDVQVDVFKISIEAVFNDAESYAWPEFKAKLATLVQVSTKTSDDDTKTISTQAAQLLNVAENLLSALQTKRFSRGTTSTDDSSAKKIAELQRTKQLIEEVIDDQERDILQTVRNSLEAETFQLESDIRARHKEPQSIKYSLERWLNRECRRVQERLERHFQSILDDTNYAVDKAYTLNVELDEISVNAFRELNVPSATKPFPKEVRYLISFGAGGATTMVVLAITRNLPNSLVAGGMVYLLAWLLSDNLSTPSKHEVQLPDLTSAVMPQFQRNVRHNTDRLSALVERAFSEAIASAQPSSPALSNQNYNAMHEELVSITDELKGMIN